jgi:hypothetical protein
MGALFDHYKDCPDSYFTAFCLKIKRLSFNLKKTNLGVQDGLAQADVGAYTAVKSQRNIVIESSFETKFSKIIRFMFSLVYVCSPDVTAHSSENNQQNQILQNYLLKFFKVKKKK